MIRKGEPIAPTAETQGRDGPHYGADLAAFHHAHFGDVARAAAAELTKRLSAAGFTRGRVVDLAAGSGILCRHVVDAGFQAFGVDLSAAMLRIARKVVPEAKFVRRSLWSTDLPGGPGETVAVTAVGEALSYAAGAAAGLPGLRDRLAAIYRALTPGGLLLFDVAGPGRGGPDGYQERCFARGPIEYDPLTNLATRIMDSRGAVTAIERASSRFIPGSGRISARTKVLSRTARWLDADLDIVVVHEIGHPVTGVSFCNSGFYVGN